MTVRALVLRFDAPMMSFGSVLVDQHGFIHLFPGQAMLTGLLANALGWHHGDFDRLTRLQERLEYAARWDVPPQRLVDYHTVDLGQPKMAQAGWTTRGTPEHRDGGQAAKFGTHQRYRHYWTDGLMTVALTVRGDEEPTLEQVHKALRRPARPLFLGRKTCLPARPLLDPHQPVLEGLDVRTILRSVPVWDRAGVPTQPAQDPIGCWPAELGVGARGRVRRVFDLRDWLNQLPAGSRWRAEGPLGGES